MTWFDAATNVAAWLIWLSLAVCYWSLWQTRRLQRKLQAERAEVITELEKAAAEWTEGVELHQQAHELANLLAELCVQGCGRDTVPVWRAWADTMGTLKVQIRGQRGTWVREIGEHAGEGLDRSA